MNSKNNEMFTEYPDIVTIDDIKKMIHVGRATALDLARGPLGGVIVGNKFRIPKINVIKYMLSMSN